MTSQNGTEAAAMTMEIAKNIVTSRGELTLLTRLIVRWDLGTSSRHHHAIKEPRQDRASRNESRRRGTPEQTADMEEYD